MRPFLFVVLIFSAANVYAQVKGPLDGVPLSPGKQLAERIFSGDVPALANCFSITDDGNLSAKPPYCQVCGTVPKGRRFKIVGNVAIPFNAIAAKEGTTAALAKVRGFEIGATNQFSGTKTLNPDVTFDLTLTCKKFTDGGKVLPFLYKKDVFRPVRTGSESEIPGNVANPGH